MKINHNITPKTTQLGGKLYQKIDTIEFFENTDAEKKTILIEMRLSILQFVDEEMNIPFSEAPQRTKIIRIDDHVLVNKNTGEWVERNGEILKEIPEEDKMTELQFYEAMLGQFIVAGLDRRIDL